MILISAGHSNTDPGAVNGKYTEADIVTDMRNMVGVYLKEANIAYIQDGTGSTNLPLNTAGKLASTADIAVEFHCNAFSSPSAQGVEALAGTKNKVIARKLCSAVSKHMNNTIRGNDGGWKDQGSGQHSRLFFVQKGGIILELFFLSNPTELARWEKVKWLVAREVAGVLIEAVGGAKPVGKVECTCTCNCECCSKCK